jgi:CO/xanthine dehydrogenase FAD-binding subunit
MPLVLQTCNTVQDTAAALKAEGARYMGGGTLVVRAANEGDLSLTTLVRSTDPSLSIIEVSGGKVKIGASVTMEAIVRHPDLTFLAKVARVIGGPAVRNMATVGGNLFAPSPYGDFAVALLALGAMVHTGSETQEIEVFLDQRGKKDGPIVSAVSFDLPANDSFRFLKVSRIKPKGVSVLSIAAVLEENNGSIANARIALGCMADRPIRAKAAEKALIGKALTKDGIAAALTVAGEGMSPPTDAIASAWYRSEVLPVHLGRLLLA